MCLSVCLFILLHSDEEQYYKLRDIGWRILLYLQLGIFNQNINGYLVSPRGLYDLPHNNDLIPLILQSPLLTIL
jgi:hypothetical protein